MRSGTQITSEFPVGSTALEQEERENLIIQAIKDKDYPDYIGNVWIPISVNAKDKNGTDHSLVLFVSPRHFELGTPEDPFLTPMWPETAQIAVNEVESILPSRLIVDYIWQSAGDNKIQIGPPKGFVIPGPDMEKTPSWIEHNRIIQEKIKDLDLYVDGKKDVVIGPNLDGSKVAIYSGPFNPNGKLREYNSGIPVHQPYSTIHHSKYSDYSHGVRPISRKAILDDREVDIVDIFKDPTLHTLVSDQGAFDPVFPNSPFRSSLSLGLSDKQQAVDPTDPLTEDKSDYYRWSIPAGLALGIFLATLNIEKMKRWLSL